MRDPVDLIARRVPRTNLENVYGIFLPRPADHEDPHRPPSAAELLRAFAAARGYVVQMGAPRDFGGRGVGGVGGAEPTSARSGHLRPPPRGACGLC